MFVEGTTVEVENLSETRVTVLWEGSSDGEAQLLPGDSVFMPPGTGGMTFRNLGVPELGQILQVAAVPFSATQTADGGE